MSITHWTLYLFIVTLLLGFGGAISGANWPHVQEWMSMVFPLVTGLTGFTCGVTMARGKWL